MEYLLDTSLSSMELYTMLYKDEYSFILDSSLYHEIYGRYTIMGSMPFDVIVMENKPEMLEIFRKKMNEYGKFKQDGKLPFHGGAVGYLSYDLGRQFETIPVHAVRDVKLPDICFGLYDIAIVIDHKERQKYIVTADLNTEIEAKKVQELINRIREFEKIPVKNISDTEHSAKTINITSNFTREEYLKAIEKIRSFIEQGDIYQANLTQRFHGETTEDALNIYTRLREISPTIFGGFLNFPQVQVISNSPERFIEKRGDHLETRPIKGTRPRGLTPKEDEALKNELLASTKDRAELLMIVDLERNDLGRVSQIGSVKVPKLFEIEEYANVSHLVATITSTMDEEKDIFDLIQETFPGGSITGAPKIKSMEIIELLEPTRRNIYTGSIGYIGFDSDMDLNIAIRTIVKIGKDVYFQAGGGITWDSIPSEEYEETLHKAASILKSLKGRFQYDA